MNVKQWLFTVLLFLTTLPLPAQQTTRVYVVYFADKPERTFDPYYYFDTAAIQRRLIAGLPLADERDLPIAPQYLKRVCISQVELLVASRWLNAAFIRTDSATAGSFKALPFV